MKERRRNEQKKTNARDENGEMRNGYGLGFGGCEILYVWSVDLRLRQSFKFQISMLHEDSREAH